MSAGGWCKYDVFIPKVKYWYFDFIFIELDRDNFNAEIDDLMCFQDDAKVN